MDTYNPISLRKYKKNKIDNKNEDNFNNNNTEIMKPKYSTNEKLMCGVIEYNNKTYFVDLNDKDRIINFNKNFVFVNLIKNQFILYLKMKINMIYEEIM